MEQKNIFEQNEKKTSTISDFRTYIRILLKYTPLIIGITIVTTGIAITYSMTATAIYEARTMLRIEQEKVNTLPTLDNVFSENSRSFDYFQTQIKLLSTRTLIKMTLDKLISEKKPFMPEEPSEGRRISYFLKKITIRAEPRSQLVSIIIEDKDKHLAQKYANMLADMYIEKIITDKMATAKYFGKWFEQSVIDQRENIKKREREFKDFKKEHNVNLFDIEFEDTKEKLQELKLKLKYLKMKSTEGFTEAEQFQLNEKLSNLEKEIDKTKENIIRLDDMSTEYKVLAQRLQASQDQYTKLLERAEESVILKGDFNPQNITIVDKAEVPEKPTKPRKTINVIFGFAFGIFLGVCIAFVIEFFDDAIKSPTDVETFLKLPFLGLIPAVNRLHGDSAIERIVTEHPKGTIAEAYRTIRTNILFSTDKASKQLVVTSAGPGEGKTSTAVNICEVMATAGDKVLLIDADMRRPRIHKIFDLDNVGLSNYLTGNAEIEDIIHKSDTETMSIIPAGPIPPNPVELLNSPRLAELLKTVNSKFDRIIIDMPPVVAVTDAAILARQSDSVIFVVHGGKAHRDIVKRGVEDLNKIGAHISGVILSNVDIFKATYYDYYYYNYYQYAYGYTEKSGDKKADKADMKVRKAKRKAGKDSDVAEL